MIASFALLAAFAAVMQVDPPAHAAVGPPQQGSGSARYATGRTWEGVGSCASMSCHGGPTTYRAPAGEYGIWLESDPHSTAYNSLLDDRSRRIEERFREKPGARAEDDSLCLSCHVHQGIVTSLHDRSFEFGDGVSCEACHGPAGNWLGLHTTGPWKQLGPDQKASYGMVPTEDLVARASACAACHVGTPEAEVNHDLIAAGHPRLNFEFGSYNAIYPKHWDGRLEKARTPDLEARAWLIGRLVTARNALDLLAARASNAHENVSDAPWPEFSEFACYACHHDLGGAPASNKAAGRPGNIPWGTWYYDAIPDEINPPALMELKKTMGSGDAPAASIARLASEASAELSRIAAIESRRPLTSSRIDVLEAGLTKSDNAGWDESVQRFLGLAALSNASSDLGARVDPNYVARLEDLRELLDFPRAFDSPRDYNPDTYAQLLRSLRP